MRQERRLKKTNAMISFLEENEIFIGISNFPKYYILVYYNTLDYNQMCLVYI